MATSKRLSAHREAVRSAADSAPDDDKDLTPEEPGNEDRENPPTTTSNKKEKSVDEETKAALEAARTEGRDTGFKSANERMNTVFASEHYAGREAAAAKMLGKPNLSAEDIVDLLADMPRAEPQGGAGLTEEQQRAAAEEAGRKEMKAALEENNNSDIDAGGGGDGKPDKRKAADDVWAKAYGLTEGAK
jgi:hypothetical protein